MNCLKCSRIIENCSIYGDVHRMFNMLNIPPQEQIVLWSMANKKIDCKRFRAIVFSLAKNEQEK